MLRDDRMERKISWFFLFFFVVSRRKFLGNVAVIREMEIIRFFEI